MMIIYIIYLIIMMMLLMMMMLYLILHKKINKNRMKMSPFESGFEPLSKMRLPFSIQFYLISIIFLIFDVEIALILPMIKTFNFNYWFMNYNFIMIMFILMIGLFIEWKEGAFYWFK